MIDRRSSPWLLSLAALACAPDPPSDTDDVILTTSTTDEDTSGTSLTGPITTTTTAATTSTATTVDAGTDSDSDSDSTSTSTTDPTTTTGPAPVCGNAVVEDGEECDDGNSDNGDACVEGCKQAVCGDKFRQMGVEECDDGNESNLDWCTNTCKVAACGDGYQYIGFEECDDGNEANDDACLNSCKIAKCGDFYVQEGVEVCDDGVNNNGYNGCAPDCMKLGPFCGDNLTQKDQGERCDGPLDPNKMPGVGCKGNCFFDFSMVQQMYCAGACSWAGPNGCDQADADLFCKLTKGKSTAKALSFKLGPPTNSFGFACGDPKLFAVIDEMGNDPRVNLGNMPEFSVNRPVMYQAKDILKTHGNVLSIVSVTCTP